MIVTVGSGVFGVGPGSGGGDGLPDSALGFTLGLDEPGDSVGKGVGGVVVGPRASELIHPVSVAVAESLTADQLAQAFTVYPSMSGSVAEAARRLQLHRRSLQRKLSKYPPGS